MNPFNRIQRYIFRENLLSLLTVIGVFCVAILLVDVVEQLRTVGTRTEIDLPTAIRLASYKLPMLIELTMPFALLAGAMMTFSRMNRRSELPAVRAAGVSGWRFLAPVITLAVLVGLLTTFVINPAGAYFTEQFERSRAQLIETNSGGGITMAGDGVWLRQGDADSQVVINARAVEQGGTELIDVKLVEEARTVRGGSGAGQFEFARRIDAEKALLRDGFWQLEGVVENVPGQPPQRMEYLTIPTNLEPEKLLNRFASPRTIGFWSLPGFIDQTQSAGLDASRYRMRWQSLLSSTVLFVAMSLIGALVCLRLSRLGGTSRLLAVGAGVALALFFVSQISSSLGAAGAAPPAIAAWSPALAALFGALAFIAYREDG